MNFYSGVATLWPREAMASPSFCLDPGHAPPPSFWRAHRCLLAQSIKSSIAPLAPSPTTLIINSSVLQNR